MAGSTEGPAAVKHLGLFTSSIFALVPGLVIHLYIIGVNVKDWWKGRAVTSVDYIVTSLVISRVCMQCTDTLYVFVEKLFLTSVNSKISMDIIDAVYSFSFFSNIWLTALLSIVFCLKISNIHTRLFLYLRGVILHRTAHLIAISELFSAVNCLMQSLMARMVVTSGGTYNITMGHLEIDCSYVNIFHSYTLGSSIPLVFYFISSVLLFFSLYHHTVKMKTSSNLSINLDTYYSAMKFVSFTFICNFIYVIGHFSWGLYFYLYCINYSWVHILLDFLLVLHSSYLIYRTARLRSQMAKVLQNLIDFLF